MNMLNVYFPGESLPNVSIRDVKDHKTTNDSIIVHTVSGEEMTITCDYSFVEITFNEDIANVSLRTLADIVENMTTALTSEEFQKHFVHAKQFVEMYHNA